MTTITETPRVYFACLAAYNNGRLHGAWVDATQDADAIREAIQAMLKASPTSFAEEWAIHDYENMPVHLGEYESVEWVAALGAAVEEHGGAKVAAYLHCLGGDADLGDLEDAYMGEADDEADYAHEYASSSGYIPTSGEGMPYREEWENIIDWNAVAGYLFDGGDLIFHDGFVFAA